jgi:ribosome biogenesis GTPase
VVDDLARLGWDDGWAHEVPAGADAVRVMAEHRGAYHVGGAGGTGWAELPGKQFHTARDKRDLPTVGDWVVVDRWDTAKSGTGAAIIRSILPRRTLLVRKAAGERTMPQPLAANVDLGLIVTSANQDLSPRRLERYLAVLRDAAVTPVIVLNKIDLVPDADAAIAAITALASSLSGGAEPRVSSNGGSGVAVAGNLEVIGTSAITPGGADALRARLDRVTSVLLGSSGVGKSTLLNGMVERDVQLTHPSRDDNAKGRHTTTRRELFALPTGGVVIDTPGMRELGLWSDEADADTATLADFADLVAVAETCRFADCTHTQEPGCAVRAAVEAGTLDPVRLASFVKLVAETRDTGKRAEVARRGADRRAGKVGARALREVLRRKYGDD